MCNLECNEIDYKLMISQSVWPSKQYEVSSCIRTIKGKLSDLLTILQKEAMKAYGFASGDTEDKSMTKNLLKVQVFFTSLNVQAVTEDPKYEVQLFDIL